MISNNDIKLGPFKIPGSHENLNSSVVRAALFVIINPLPQNKTQSRPDALPHKNIVRLSFTYRVLKNSWGPEE